MNINKLLKTAGRTGRKGLVIFLPVGDRSLDATVEFAKVAFDSGADIVELGVPFSDSIADGELIQSAFSKAIANGVSLEDSFDVARAIRAERDAGPIALMLSVSLVFGYSIEKFMRAARSAGVDGVIIPDAPPEEYAQFARPARANGIETILLAAPSSDRARVRRILRYSRGFLYYVNISGVTGSSGLSETARKKSERTLAMIRAMTNLPVLVGFGISSPRDARRAARLSDGVIIGSQAIRVIEQTRSSRASARALASYVRSIRSALDSI